MHCFQGFFLIQFGVYKTTIFHKLCMLTFSAFVLTLLCTSFNRNLFLNRDKCHPFCMFNFTSFATVCHFLDTKTNIHADLFKQYKTKFLSFKSTKCRQNVSTLRSKHYEGDKRTFMSIPYVPERPHDSVFPGNYEKTCFPFSPVRSRPISLLRSHNLVGPIQK